MCVCVGVCCISTVCVLYFYCVCVCVCVVFALCVCVCVCCICSVRAISQRYPRICLIPPPTTLSTVTQCEFIADSNINQFHLLKLSFLGRLNKLCVFKTNHCHCDHPRPYLPHPHPLGAPFGHPSHNCHRYQLCLCVLGALCITMRH